MIVVVEIRVRIRFPVPGPLLGFPKKINRPPWLVPLPMRDVVPVYFWGSN